jgi:glycosyltransferase involved in cell wall biosynthesis
LLRRVLYVAFKKPTLAIRISSGSPDDPGAVHAKNTRIIPNGLPDRSSPDPAERAGPPLILFSGVLRESKGVLVALEALGAVAAHGFEFRAVFAGPWVSDEFRARAYEEVDRLGLHKRTTFPGALRGEDYLTLFDQAFAFCFPTFFESETFGVVAVEAMRSAVPVVATRWRGLVTLIRDSETGFLVEPRDAGAVAARLEELLSQPALAHRMGRQGRSVYEREYQLDLFLDRIGDALRSG